MLRVAQGDAANLCRLVRADAICLPFRDACFDVVYTSRCLINLPERAMQQAALLEILRVVHPRGTVILTENFQEPVDRLNRVRERLGDLAEHDPHNLRLNCEDTLRSCREHGWIMTRAQGFPLSSLVAHVLIGWFARRRGGRHAQRLLTPLVGIAARLDDVASRWLPYFGKDMTLTLTRAALGSGHVA